MTAPVLKMPDPEKPFILETDASKWAIGAALMQADENEQLHPCGYLSHALTPTEQNWQIYDREFYAIIYALEEWRYLLLRAPHTITIHCDHKNLTYYRTPQRLTARQARWWNNLSRYNYKLIHTPGSKLTQADALSRRPDHVTDQNDEENVIVFPDDVMIRSIAEDLRDKIILATTKDSFVATLKTCFADKTPPPLRTAISDWEFQDGLVLFKGKCYIPQDTNLR